MPCTYFSHISCSDDEISETSENFGNFEKWPCTDGVDVAPHAFRTFGVVLILLEGGHPSVRSSLLYMNRNVLRVTKLYNYELM